ncbi:MAG: BMC domain-containing protein [Lachnospiraceae bacterium]|nr:BMC domain-containing protein [Lachnospiraceae bacterium]
MGNAYGFIEITGVVAAMDALDIMCKTAGVTLATWERKLGGRLVTLVVEGDVEAVRQSVEAATANALKKPVSTGILPNPHPEIIRMVELSASRFKGKAEPSSTPKQLGEDPPDFVPKETTQEESS